MRTKRQGAFLSAFKGLGRLIVMRDTLDVPVGTVAEVKGFCKITNKPYSVVVWYNDWRKYTKGVYSAADCFPYLSETDLDIIITGIIERN